jgi:DNA-binding transcriptional MocR family regulator
VTVPEGIDTKAMLPRAITQRVAYASGTGFYADKLGSRQLRISYCYPTPERIREGIRRLANVLEDEAQLHATFGPTTSRELSGPQNPSPDTA